MATGRAAPLANCGLCPRQCGIDRLAGATGFCRAGLQPRVFRYGPHAGEEPPISGTRGSGTVFFSRCTLHCLYCQNFPWSQEGKGDDLTTDGLRGVLEALRTAGCHNWNLVSPTPWLPQIEAAWRGACDSGPRIPVVVNTSGYERVETLQTYGHMVDIYLTDLRYADPETAREASGAPDYVTVAREALREMWRQRGPLVCDENGIALSGTVCRLLILPGHADEAVRNLEWLAETLGVTLPVSVMAQYVPAYQASEYEPWGRVIDRKEYDTVCEAIDRLGFDAGWIQEFGTPSPAALLGHRMPAGNGIARPACGETVRKGMP